MRIRRYLVLVAALVAMGLATVRWKNQTLSAGYESVRLERKLRRTAEEERVEDSCLAVLTSPVRVCEQVEKLQLRLRSKGTVAVARRGRRGDPEGRSVVMAGAASRRRRARD